MNTTRIIVCLCSLFALGTLSGIGISGTARKTSAGGAVWSEKQWLDQRFQDDRHRLKLTPEQEQSFRQGYELMGADLRALQQETAGKVRDILRRRGIDLIRTLDEAQREEFRKLSAERMARQHPAQP